MQEVRPRRGEVVVVEPKVGEPLSGFGLEQDVGGRDQGVETFAIGGIVEVQGYAALARVVVPPIQAAVFARLVVQMGRVVTGGIAGRGLHEDDVGPHVCEQLAGQRDGFVG